MITQEDEILKAVKITAIKSICQKSNIEYKFEKLFHGDFHIIGEQRFRDIDKAFNYANALYLSSI